MIPVRLSINNFLSYRGITPVLDFESIHIACLCGDNGHGKSALLDAITWVLWGKARTGQENLIHKGQTDMAVELEFLARDQPYRVSRRHSRSRRSRQGHTVLELQIGSMDSSSFRPITGNTINETQSQIIDILHMDYDTFINTAFMRQGDADRFTNARPTERKGILSEVLDLSYYENLEDHAKERVIQLSQSIQEIDVNVSVHRQELENKSKWETELSTACDETHECILREEIARKTVDTLTQKISFRKNQQIQLNDLDRQLQNLDARIIEIKIRTDHHRKVIAIYEELFSRKDEIERAFLRLKEASNQREKFVSALSKKNPLDQELAGLQQVISIERERLTGRIGQLRNEIENILSPKANRMLEIKDRRRELEPKRIQMTNIKSKIEADEVQLSEFALELDNLYAAQEKKTIFERRKFELRSEIDNQTKDLIRNAEAIRDSIETDVRPKADLIKPLETELKKLQSIRNDLDTQSGDIIVTRSRLNEIESQLALLDQEGKILIHTMQDTRRKFDLLVAGDNLCPVCRQSLADQGLSHLRSEYEKEGRNSRELYSKSKSQQTQKQLELEKLTKSVNLMEADYETRTLGLQADISRVNIEIENSKRAQDELNALTLRHKELEVCRIAGDYAHNERNKLNEIEAKLLTIDFNDNRLKKIQVSHRELGRAIADLQSQLSQDLLSLQREADKLDRDYEESTVALAQLESTREELKTLEAILGSKDYAVEARIREVEIQKAIGVLKYDREAHLDLEKIVSELDEYTDLHQSLQNAIGNLTVEQELFTAASSELARTSKEKSLMDQKRISMKQAVLGLPGLDAKLKGAIGDLNTIESELGNHRIKIGVLNSRLQRCNEIESLVKGYQNDQAHLIDEKSLYSELVLAFGKNGIQALIIEDAIPQLETDANELLARLTDNRMTLRLELKEGRRVRGTDALSEELDLSISDELGTRGYETFSGGETFRINFALRIALSRLLARRSGAPLRILFIDEGFGSQDTTGQESLTEAIQFIQSDFEKIIVITHIEHIKEAFPVRIEVTKTDMGSSFQVV